MTTHVMDVVTLMKALNMLERTYLGPGRTWGTANAEQERFFYWYNQFAGALPSLSGLIGKADISATALNAFLAEHGFDPMFREPLDGIGGVGIIKMLLEWLYRGTDSRLTALNGGNYASFDLPESAFGAYSVPGYSTPLVKIATKGGKQDLWALQMDEVAGFEMLERAFWLANFHTGRPLEYNKLRMPVVDIHGKPDVSWLVGADTFDANGGYWFVAQAMQEFKFRMNAVGAKVEVASGVVMRKCAITSDLLTFDGGFLFFATQSAVPNLPIAVGYADFDSFQAQAIELEGEAGQGQHAPERGEVRKVTRGG